MKVYVEQYNRHNYSRLKKGKKDTKNWRMEDEEGDKCF